MTRWWHTKKSIVIKTALFTAWAKCFGMLKISLVIGSLATFFSFSGVVIPLSGACTSGATIATALFFIRLLFKLTISGGYYLSEGLLGKVLVHYIPGYMAALYWAVKSSWLRVGIPLCCIVLFVAHPVGYNAYPYTFCWFIPIIVYKWFSEHTGAVALASTFMAHAVGSVIWIYTVPMTVEQYYALIPLVLLERLLYALGMTVCYRSALLLQQPVHSFVHQAKTYWSNKLIGEPNRV